MGPTEKTTILPTVAVTASAAARENQNPAAARDYWQYSQLLQNTADFCQQQQMANASNFSSSSSSSQKNSMQRVKLYRLNDDGKWDDQGTGHATIDYLDMRQNSLNLHLHQRSEDLGLFVIDEEGNKTLLVHRISSDDIYQIISWRELDDSSELALSFLENIGCSYIWDHICNVQRNLRFTTPSNPSDESADVANVENSTPSEKSLQENILLSVSEATMKYKTAPIFLSLEAIEHQYGNTIKEAAKNLNVSTSTFKRKYKAFGISEWQGPSPAKKKVKDSSAKNEEYDGAVQNPLAINKNETLTIKAEYADDMIKFHLCVSKATFITVEEEIGKKFKLTHGTYKLKYLDEDKDWILLASDQDMSDCIKSSRNLDRILLRIRVLPSTQPISR